MSRTLLASEKGITLLAVLMLVMIMGIMCGMVGETWSMIMRRDREEELLFRGKQIKTAIQRYNDNNAKFGAGIGGVRDFDVLLKDNRTASSNRYLRKSWNDPITGKEWQLIKDPIKGIIGVASPSEQTPLKKDNFPQEFKEFKGKEKYNQWQFVYQAQQTSQPGQAGQASQPGQTGQTAQPKTQSIK